MMAQKGLKSASFSKGICILQTEMRPALEKVISECFVKQRYRFFRETFMRWRKEVLREYDNDFS